MEKRTKENYSSEHLEKCDKLFLKRFLYIAKYAVPLYTFAQYSIFEDKIYQAIETILFDDDSVEFDKIALELRELEAKDGVCINIEHVDENINYSSKIFQLLYVAIVSQQVNTLTKSKKIGMLLKYNQCYGEYAYPLTVDGTEGKDFQYKPISHTNQFMDVVSSPQFDTNHIETILSKESQKSL